jgi:phosphomannomutase / phosphoglucomutase
MNPHIFREYDVRGVVGRDLDAEVAVALGRGLGTLVAERLAGRAGRVLVGRDCRLSSPELADAVARGLEQTGMRVVELGMVPTPVLYFAAHQQDADAAVQVTGSHNPPEYNGLKVVVGGASFYGEAIQALRRVIESGTFTLGNGTRESAGTAVEDYVRWVTENVRPGRRRLKVVVDAGNGAGGPAAVAVLEGLGVDVVPLYCEPDGRFPNHHPDPTQLEALAALREAVGVHAADLGVGLDGDADRIGVIDERGEVLWGDKLLLVLARRLLQESPGAMVLGEVKCSQTLFDDIEAHGGRPLMWKVGHSLIKAKMKETGALLAGEMSGHVFFSDRYFGFDDAIYTAARLVELLSSDERPLSAYLEGVPATFATPELRIDAGDDAAKFRAAEAVARHYREGGGDGVREVVTLDGVRVVFADGWGLVRASNTQPVLVMRAEATSAARRDALEAELRGRIDEALRQARSE